MTGRQPLRPHSVFGSANEAAEDCLRSQTGADHLSTARLRVGGDVVALAADEPSGGSGQ